MLSWIHESYIFRCGLVPVSDSDVYLHSCDLGPCSSVRFWHVPALMWLRSLQSLEKKGLISGVFMLCIWLGYYFTSNLGTILIPSFLDLHQAPLCFWMNQGATVLGKNIWILGKKHWRTSKKDLLRYFVVIFWTLFLFFFLLDLIWEWYGFNLVLVEVV